MSGSVAAVVDWPRWKIDISLCSTHVDFRVIWRSGGIRSASSQLQDA